MAVLPRACIIGAGISGLSTAKALKDKGVPFDCFEMSDRVGGNWVFKNRNGRSAAYRSLHIDTSKERLQLDDFPIALSDRHLPDYPHHTHVAKYMSDYCDHFGLRPLITFETEVQHAERLADGVWRVRLSTGEVRHYDALFVCNGHHWDPRWPEPRFPGTFAGIDLHSHDYIDPFEPVDMRGKSVIVVGIGNSGIDISSDLGQRGIAERVYISTRRGAHVMPLYLFGKPADKGKTVSWLPLVVQRRILEFLVWMNVGRMESYGLPKPDHRLLETHPSCSGIFLTRVGNGDIVPKPDIAELMGDRVRFTDGSVVQADVIIYATGYKISFPFFDAQFLSAPDNRLPLFRRAIKPGIDNLFFIGLAQPLPTLINFGELQAKWLAELMVGNYVPPPVAEMQASIAHDERRFLGHVVKTPRHTMQCDYDLYKVEIRKELRRGQRRARRRGGRPWIEPRAHLCDDRRAAAE
jgi:cation diffusion facilitator CzcD-associated flavoprotein CzcO